jgi:hypothetical protein
MPDFDLRFEAVFTPTAWVDPASVSPIAASRLNSDPEHPQLYARVVVPQTFVIAAVVSGVLAPADATLGGRLFEVHWVEFSGNSPPIYVQSPFGPGFSSVVQIRMLAEHIGHFSFAFMRPGGGAVLWHWDGASS